MIAEKISHLKCAEQNVNMQRCRIFLNKQNRDCEQKFEYK